MTLSRKLEITTALISAVAAGFVLTACGSSAPAPAASPSPSPTFTALTLHDACRVLRDDILANGGTPDRATLHRIIDHSTDGQLIADARGALPDVGAGSDAGIRMGVDLAVMYHDCRSTGVQIPTNGSA